MPCGVGPILTCPSFEALSVAFEELPIVSATPGAKTIKKNTNSTQNEAPVPGHQLAEDRAKRFEHVDLTIEATACGHEGS